jgi:hypothetical protein
LNTIIITEFRPHMYKDLYLGTGEDRLVPQCQLSGFLAQYSASLCRTNRRVRFILNKCDCWLFPEFLTRDFSSLLQEKTENIVFKDKHSYINTSIILILITFLKRGEAGSRGNPDGAPGHSWTSEEGPVEDY